MLAAQAAVSTSTPTPPPPVRGWSTDVYRRRNPVLEEGHVSVSKLLEAAAGGATPWSLWCQLGTRPNRRGPKDGRWPFAVDPRSVLLFLGWLVQAACELQHRGNLVVVGTSRPKWVVGSRERWGQLIGCSGRTVTRLVAELLELGLIEQQRLTTGFRRGEVPAAYRPTRAVLAWAVGQDPPPQVKPCPPSRVVPVPDLGTGTISSSSRLDTVPSPRGEERGSAAEELPPRRWRGSWGPVLVAEALRALPALPVADGDQQASNRGGARERAAEGRRTPVSPQELAPEAPPAPPPPRPAPQPPGLPASTGELLDVLEDLAARGNAFAAAELERRARARRRPGGAR